MSMDAWLGQNALWLINWDCSHTNPTHSCLTKLQSMYMLQAQNSSVVHYPFSDSSTSICHYGSSPFFSHTDISIIENVLSASLNENI